MTLCARMSIDIPIEFPLHFLNSVFRECPRRFRDLIISFLFQIRSENAWKSNVLIFRESIEFEFETIWYHLSESVVFTFSKNEKIEKFQNIIFSKQQKYQIASKSLLIHIITLQIAYMEPLGPDQANMPIPSFRLRYCPNRSIS